MVSADASRYRMHCMDYADQPLVNNLLVNSITSGVTGTVPYFSLSMFRFWWELIPTC